MSKNPNPQGKGLVPILQSLANAQPRIRVPPKQIRRIASELFTSLFVLGSEFKFQPVIGKSYWLYRVGDRFKLMLIAPCDWSCGYPGQLIGECVLQEDVTWTLTLDAHAAEDRKLMALVSEQHRALQAALESADTLEEALPAYNASMRYHSRVLAYGLVASLKASMHGAGIARLSYRDALSLIADRSDSKMSGE